MIIYALVIIAALFFLSWNLIDNPKMHFITSLVTTVMFLIAMFFAVANFRYHYGMHEVRAPGRTRRIMPTSGQSSLKTLIYRPMGDKRESQLVIYRNNDHKVVHTDPDQRVTNRIVKSEQVVHPHMNTSSLKWTYRNSWYRSWFGLAKKASTDRVHNVFYVPKSWDVLSAKQAVAFKQIVKNRSKQLKSRMNTSQVKQQMRQKAAIYVKAELTKAMQKDPKMSGPSKQRVIKDAKNQFENRLKQKAESKLISEALQTVKTIN